MPRNPHSILYEGAPGWSLQSFLWIAARTREYIPDLAVSVFLTSGEPPIRNDDPQVIFAHRAMFADVQKRLNVPWISVEHRRAEADDFERVAVWCYPTHFPEDGCIRTARMAQKHGAIPVFNPIGSLAQKVFAGIPIYGIPHVHPMAQCRYAYEIIGLLLNEALQERVRVPMMEIARQTDDAVEDIITEATKIDGWMTEEELRWLAKVAGEADSFVEIGCWKGRSTYAVAASCKGTVTAVDHWLGGKDEPEHIRQIARSRDLHAEFLGNVGHFPNLKVIWEPSTEAAPFVEAADVIFIDAGHAEDDVRADIRAWRGKARKLLCGHDYDWETVQRAVHAELGPVEKGPGSIWFYVCEGEKSAAA